MRYVCNHTRSYSIKTIARSLIALTLATSSPSTPSSGTAGTAYDDVTPRQPLVGDGHYHTSDVTTGVRVAPDRQSPWTCVQLAGRRPSEPGETGTRGPPCPQRARRPPGAPMPPPASTRANAQYYCFAGRYYPSTCTVQEGWQLVQPPGW